jgi:outer membrane translocation and assembly module TamA
VDLENYHNQWDGSTLRAADERDIYRNRLNVQPALRFRLTPNLSLTSGVSLERFDTQFPAARTEASNSVVNTLRYRRSWELSDASQTLDAAYTLRAATRALESDYVYARHLVSGTYVWQRGRSTVRLTAMGGKITGQAPLFERFILGNSTTLRGWSKFDIDPLGGSRGAYGSAEYRYRLLQAFYDSGAVWNPGQTADVKKAVGGGVHTGNLYFSVGFPVGGGRSSPIFLMAMNF